MFNPQGSQQLPWSLWGGLNTELSGPTLPTGLSPDCQDIAFVPGEARTRPALGRIFSSSNFGNVGVTYVKTFTQPNQSPLNLYLTADGVMHVQDVTNTPTSFSTLFSAVPGVFATSVTAFGREYMAFSDGWEARDIPRQYDPSLSGGVRRITQDGPACVGTQLSAADAPTTTVPISTIVPRASTSITTATNLDAVVTIVTSAAHGLAVNDQVLITGVSVWQYNGTVVVATVPNPTSFTFAAGASGWTQGTGGTVVPLEVTVTTTADHGLIAGETITIGGDSDLNYDNSTAASTKVGLSQGKCRFYAMASNGQFNLTHPAPPPATTYTFQTFGGPPSGDSIMFNPDSRYLADILPGLPFRSQPLSTNHPMQIWGVLDSTGNWNNNTSVIWGSASTDWGMTVVFNLQFPSAGTYTFRMVHDDGAFFGCGGGITAVSGPNNNPQNQTQTAELGLPIMASNNQRANDGTPSIWNDTIVVSVPAAGTYPAEIDYCQAGSDQVLTLQYSPDSGVTWKSIVPGGVQFATPPTWLVAKVTGSRTFTFDATYADSTGIGGTVTIGGLIAPGIHKCAVSFLTDTDYITKPCPPITWTSAGSKRVVLSGLPIGPPNTKARVVHFSGAGGGNFFTIPVPALDPASGQKISTSTWVLDNTSTSATFDFADNTLFAAIAVDIVGNNLFNLVTLGPCAGIFNYSNRIFVWGDSNKINTLLNMGFEGGTATVGGTTPLGWTVGAGGLMVNAGDFYYGWRITGNGTATARGMITQPAYQDYLFQPVLTPTTQYSFDFWAYCSAPNMPGSIKAEFYSATGGGVLATATVNANAIPVGQANAAFVSADFSAKTPAVIPSDTVLRIYGLSLGNNQTVTIDEMMVVYTAQPTVPGQARVSYAVNPESFDGVSGIYDIEYPEALRSQKIIRDNLYTLSANHLSRTTDSGIGEPITWTNYTVSDVSGGMSIRAFDVGEGWGVFAAESGLYAFSGGEPIKISQEIQTLWTAIDPLLRNHVWVKNDPINRRVYVGVPLTAYSPTGATFTPASCNKILVMDYRELNTGGMIENASPLAIGFSGKMLTTDLKRKQCVWNIPSNCGDILAVGGDAEPQIVFGGGLGNGLATGYGNAYQLVDGQYSDDDYGQIGALNGEGVTRNGVWRPQAAYYVTYFAPSHEEEMGLQIGAQRKLYAYLEAYVRGVGNLYVVPLMDRLGNPTKRPPKKRALSLFPNFDTEWPLNVQAQRIALLFYALPVGS